MIVTHHHILFLCLVLILVFHNLVINQIVIIVDGSLYYSVFLYVHLILLSLFSACMQYHWFFLTSDTNILFVIECFVLIETGAIQFARAAPAKADSIEAKELKYWLCSFLMTFQIVHSFIFYFNFVSLSIFSFLLIILLLVSILIVSIPSYAFEYLSSQTKYNLLRL